MAKNTADVEMIVHYRQALRAMQAMEQRFNKMYNQMAKGTDKVNRKTSQSKTSFDQMSSSIKSVVANTVAWMGTMGSVYKILGMVREEIESVDARTKQNRTRSLTYSESLESLRTQVPQKIPGTIQDMSFEEIKQKIRSVNYPDMAELVQIVEGYISTDPYSKVSERVKNAIEAAFLRVDLQTKGEAQVDYTKAIAGQVRTFGGSVQGQAGMMAMAQSSSQITDSQSFAKYLGPAAEKLAQFGYTQAEAMRVLSAFTTAAVDWTGETSQTNVVKVLGQQLSGIVTEVTGKQDIRGQAMINLMQSDTRQGAEIRRRLLGMMEEGLTPEQLILAKEYGTGKMVGKSAGKVALFNLAQKKGVGEQGAMKTALRASTLAIPDDWRGGEKFWKDLQAKQRQDEDWKILKLDRELKAGYEGLSVSRTRDTLNAMLNESSKKLEDQAGGYSFEGTLKQMVSQAYTGQRTGAEAAGALRQQWSKMLERKKAEVATGIEYKNPWFSAATKAMQGFGPAWEFARDVAPSFGKVDSEERELKKEEIRVLKQFIAKLDEIVGKPAKQNPAKKPEAEVLAQ